MQLFCSTQKAFRGLEAVVGRQSLNRDKRVQLRMAEAEGSLCVLAALLAVSVVEEANEKTV